jgi:hypothetical protein
LRQARFAGNRLKPADSVISVPQLDIRMIIYYRRR